jgi:predicted metalloprotease with PDZ domain
MIERRTHALALACLLCLLPARAEQREQSARAEHPEISFNVSMPEPHTHLLRVSMRVRAAGARQLPPSVSLVMPVWTPGSYLVREYARHVQDFAAREAGGAGRALAWRKTNKNTWRVETGGAREFEAEYAVYSNELSVRTNELNDRRAFWNNAALLMYPEGHLAAPSTVRVSAPAGWKIASALPNAAGRPDAFRAENFDALYDAPFLVSDFKTVQFDVRGVAHRIVLDGEGNYDAEALRRDFKKIVEANVALMGDVPYPQYTFFLLTAAARGGGLEHANSTAIIAQRFGFRPESAYRQILATVAHEHFHAWNVKRIRPDALGPFDYTAENYTRLLWVAEGVTSYYDNLILRRAGLTSDRDYLTTLAGAIRTLQNTPGRFERSLEESSFDAWIKQYRPDENQINSTVSYYEKGEIVSLLLDLEIRRRSSGARSLDDVMRRLHAEFGRRGRNFTPEDFQRACEWAAGSALEEFFRRYVRGRDELDYNAALAAVGLRLETVAGGAQQPPAQPRPHFGANLRQEGDRLLVTNVPAGTPAYDQGVYAGDQIVAVGGFRAATLENFNARVSERKPGEELHLTLFRGDELRTVSVKLGARAEENYRIVPVKDPTPEQTKLYESWLGATFPK